MSSITIPKQLSSFPRTPLLFDYPSPIHQLPRISEDLNREIKISSKPAEQHRKVTIWAKREDLNSPLAFGGNKMRKLEFVFPEILESTNNYDTIVTCGGTRSNSMRQVAAAAARYGLDVKLVQRPGSVNWKEPDHENYHTLGSIQITNLIAGKAAYINDPTVEETMEALRQEGKRPYYIPVGASTHPLGGIGYARFAFEILQQEIELGVKFDVIVVPTASGSTVAGMVAGFRLADKYGYNGIRTARGRRIISMFCGSDPDVIRRDLLVYAKKTAVKIGLDEEDISEQDYDIRCEYNAGAYGVVDERTINAMKYAARMEGMVLDPVYTGKGFAGLLDIVKSRKVDESSSGDSNILFVHTGGQSVLSAYSHIQFD